MAIVGIGIDLVEIERVERALQRWGDRFLARIMAPEEAARVPKGEGRTLAVALAVAAKEAASKALGTGWTQGVAWRQVVVDVAAPSVRLEGAAALRARRLGGSDTRTRLEVRDGLALGQVRLVS